MAAPHVQKQGGTSLPSSSGGGFAIAGMPSGGGFGFGGPAIGGSVAAADSVITKQTVRNTSFSSEDLNKAWLEYADGLEDKIMIVQAIKLSGLDLSSDFKVTVSLSNKYQLDDMHDEVPDIVAYLKDRLSNDLISLEFVVDEALQAEVSKTESEMFKEEVEADKNVRLLVEKLDLEFF